MGIVSQPAFNGGTITQGLKIAPTNPNVIPLSIEASWNAIAVDFLRVLNTDTSTRLFAVDVQGQTLAFPHTSEAEASLTTSGSAAQLATAGNFLMLVAGKTLALYGAAPIARQTGVPVTAAGIHAACVAAGLFAA